MGVYYEEYGNGNGPLIMFLHGGGVSGWMWDKQVAYFLDYHCIVPSIQNKDYNTQFSIRGYAEAMIDLLKEKAVGKPVTIVGFSLGAQIAIEMISIAPELICNAIINSALVKPMPLVRTFIGPTVKLTSWMKKNRAFSKIQAKEFYVGEAMFEQYFQESKQMNSEGIVRMLRENLSFGLPSNFGGCTTRILVTIGELEKKVMKLSMARIIESSTCASGIVIPNVGHGFSFAYPNLFNRTVDAWINNRRLPTELLLTKRKKPKWR